MFLRKCPVFILVILKAKGSFALSRYLWIDALQRIDTLQWIDALQWIVTLLRINTLQWIDTLLRNDIALQRTSAFKPSVSRQ